MIMQKSAPPLARRSPSPDHVFGDAGLRNLKPEFEQFAVDARRAHSRFSTLICHMSARSSD